MNQELKKIASDLEQQVWQRLRQVLDPELNINLVDLGLIYEVKVEWPQLIKNKKGKLVSNQTKHLNSPKIHILMTLTTPGCPLAAVFEPMIRENLIGLSWGNDEVDDKNDGQTAGGGNSNCELSRRLIDIDHDVSIQLTFDPPWVMEMMSEEAKAELGF